MWCQSPEHPQVPVTMMIATARYCHACSDWQLTFGMFTQTGDTEPSWDVSKQMNLGPFDVPVDVAHWIAEALEEELTASGSPWDLRR